MSSISENWFRSSVVGTDPVTKGTFIIQWANFIYDLESQDDGTGTAVFKEARVEGQILIEGPASRNPLYQVARDHMLRLQGLMATVIFGAEKKLIRFDSISDYQIQEDGIVNEIELKAVFEILNNLEYLENIQAYKENNLL